MYAYSICNNFNREVEVSTAFHFSTLSVVQVTSTFIPTLVSRPSAKRKGVATSGYNIGWMGHLVYFYLDVQQQERRSCSRSAAVPPASVLQAPTTSEHHQKATSSCREIYLLSRPTMPYCWEMEMLSRRTIKLGDGCTNFWADISCKKASQPPVFFSMQTALATGTPPKIPCGELTALPYTPSWLPPPAPFPRRQR